MTVQESVPLRSFIPTIYADLERPSWSPFRSRRVALTVAPLTAVDAAGNLPEGGGARG